MEELNPYTAPRTDPTIAEDPGDGPFGHLDFNAVRRLRNDSHSIRAIGLLGLLGALLMVILAVTSQFSAIIVAIGLLGAAAAYCSWWRPAWGPVVGILFCALLLIGIPIGTFLGLLGMLSFGRSRSIFGPGRFRHQAIEQEWRARRRERRGR